MNKTIKMTVLLIFVLFVGFVSGLYLYDYIYGWRIDTITEKYFFEDEDYLQIVKPSSCKSSSQLNEYQGCENLYDLMEGGWEDANKNCENQWVEYYFDNDVFVEFVTIENYGYPGLFAQKDKIKDIEMITSDGTKFPIWLEESTNSQWYDVYHSTKYLRFNVLSSYDTLGIETCHLQEITVYGRNQY